MISHDSVRLQRHLQMMRSRNKIDALMVDDIHECRGSGRYRNRQIKHIVVDFPLHFRLAIWGDVRGFGMGEISPITGAIRNRFQPGSTASRPPICACIHSATDPSA